MTAASEVSTAMVLIEGLRDRSTRQEHVEVPTAHDRSAREERDKEKKKGKKGKEKRQKGKRKKRGML